MSTHKQKLDMAHKLLKTLSMTELEHQFGHRSDMSTLAYLDFKTLKATLRPKAKGNPNNQ
ncbi:hypothetical protein D3C76_991340 [compost metagenome]